MGRGVGLLLFMAVAAAAALGAHAEVMVGQHLHQGVALLEGEFVFAAFAVGHQNLHATFSLCCSSLEEVVYWKRSFLSGWT